MRTLLCRSILSSKTKVGNRRICFELDKHGPLGRLQHWGHLRSTVSANQRRAFAGTISHLRR